MLLLRRNQSPAAHGLSSKTGLTLIDLVIATTVMVIGALGAVGTIQTTTALSQSTRETTTGYQACRAMLESLQAEPFDNVFRRFNSDEADDPIGSLLPAPGDGFQVAGMNLQALDADGLVGRMFFPMDDFGVLREDINDPSLGMPRDLNGDGIIDGDNRINDYILLPVRVRAEWSGNTGDRFVEFTTLLSKRR